MNYNDYRKEKMQALKSKDTFKNKVLTNILSALTYESKELGRELTDAETDKVVKKLLKQATEARDMASSRPELAAEAQKEVDLLESFLPAQLSEDDIKVKLNALFEEAGVPRNKSQKGQLMKLAMGALAGQADGKVIAHVVDLWLEA